MKKLIITVDDDAMNRASETQRAFEAQGLKECQYFEQIGQYIGDYESDDIRPLQNIQGVVDISMETEFQLPPPEDPQ